jgi:hypothetical protein
VTATDGQPTRGASEPDELRTLLDRVAIRDCIDQYFHALDSRSFNLLDNVFAPLVDVADGQPPVALDQLKQRLAGVGQFRVSHHGVRNTSITLDGDRASANTYAVDMLLIDDPDHVDSGRSWPTHDTFVGPVIRSHGLRYVDDFQRLDSGWRITRRRGPIALWRYHLSGVQVHPDVDRLRSGEL